MQKSNYYCLKYPGFSLIELMIALSIIMSFIFLSSSGLSHIYKKNKLEKVTENIKSAIKLARFNAIANNETILIKPIDENNWSQGIKINSYSETSGLKLVHVWSWKKYDVKVTWHGFQSANFLLFNSDINKNAVNGYFSIENNFIKHKLVINRLGRIKDLFYESNKEY